MARNELGNQGALHDDVKLYLDDLAVKKLQGVIYDHCEEVDKGHGRIETRKYWITDNINWLENREDWSNLKSIGMVESTREIDKQITTERRYYISSLPANALKFGKVVRQHWGIENTLHWTLDVVFSEDYSRIRERSAAENMAIIRHVALNTLQLAKGNYKDTSLKALRKKAGWGNDTLRQLLLQKF